MFLRTRRDDPIFFLKIQFHRVYVIVSIDVRSATRESIVEQIRSDVFDVLIHFSVSLSVIEDAENYFVRS